MANVKITQLPLATTPLTGTEDIPLVQGTTTKQVTVTGLFTSPVMTNPTLGTVGQADLINATGLPISTGVAGLGTGVATFLGTPSSANLRTAVTDETGTGSLVFATSPTLVTPNLGTPTTLVATNATGTALGLIAGSAVTNANLTGAVTSVGNATSLGSFTSAQLITALTDETGSGSAVFSNSPTLVNPALGTPSALVGTNITGTAANFNINGTVGATTPSTVTGTTITANTRFVGTNFDAAGSGGGALRTSSSANVLQWGGGGGVNLTLDGAFNMNPANASISIAPTGSGTLTINPATAGTINNMAIGGTTPAAGAFTTLSATSAIAVTSGGTGQTSYTDGQLLIGNSTGNTLTKATLTAGTGVTITNGSGAITINATGTGGDVVGPASSTDNALARFDSTTGKIIQNSVGILSDTGAISGLTDISASGSVTLSGGTANGVTYLNGSKVLTSGSALTFDGTLLNVGDSTSPTGLTPLSVLISTNTSTGQVLNVRKSCDTALGSSISLMKSRGTAASPVVVNAGDTAGGVIYSAFAGTNYRQLASINGTVEAYVSDTNISGYLVFNTNSASTGTAERMRLDSSGNLGIGTSSPNKLLTLNSATNDVEVLRINAPGASGGVQAKADIGFGFFDTVAEASAAIGFEEFGTSSAGGILLFKTRPDGASQSTRPTEQMRITQAGLVGIGTSSPNAKLEISATTEQLRLTNSTNRVRFTTETDGTLTIGNTSFSLITLKQNIGGGVVYGGFQYVDTNRDFALGAASGKGVAILVNGSSTASAYVDSSGNLGLGVTPSAWSGWGVPVFQQSNAGTIVSNDTNAYYGANWYYGTGSFRYIQSSAASYLKQTSGAFQFFSAASGTAGNAITFTQAMTLDASGTLLLGGTTSNFTSSGRGVAEINGSSESLLGFNRANSGSAYIWATSSSFRIINKEATPLTFSTSETERARIDSSGNLLVGTTTVLDVAMITTVAPASRRGISAKTVTSAYGVLQLWNADTTGNNAIADFYTDGSQTLRGNITYNRTAGLIAYNTTSDYRAKNIIGPVTDSGALIDSVPVYMGKMKGATQERPMFIAHETPAYAHIGVKDAVDADGNPVYQQMDASALIPVMWAEIQSLRQRLSAANL